MRIKKLQLTKSQNRNQFDCGVEELNQFFRAQARQADARQLVRTWAIVNANDHTEVLAFYSSSACEIHAPKEMKGLGNYPYPIPFIRLTRMATDLKYRGTGLGEIALMSAIADVARVNEFTAVGGLVVDAKNEDVAKFYGRYEFIPVEADSLTLFLPVKDCIALAEEMGELRNEVPVGT